MWNFKYSIFDIQHLIFDIQYLISNIISNIRNGKGGNLVDLITVNEMCYKSANVANVANVLQIGIGRILFLLESTKLIVIVRLSLEIGINVKCQEEVARHSL